MAGLDYLGQSGISLSFVICLFEVHLQAENQEIICIFIDQDSQSSSTCRDLGPHQEHSPIEWMVDVVTSHSVPQLGVVTHRKPNAHPTVPTMLYRCDTAGSGRSLPRISRSNLSYMGPAWTCIYYSEKTCLTGSVVHFRNISEQNLPLTPLIFEQVNKYVAKLTPNTSGSRPQH